MSEVIRATRASRRRPRLTTHRTLTIILCYGKKFKLFKAEDISRPSGELNCRVLWPLGYSRKFLGLITAILIHDRYDIIT